MSTELTFLIVTFAVANLLVMGLVLAFPSDRGRRGGGSREGTSRERLPAPYLPTASPEPDVHGATSVSSATYDRILRLLWWLTISGVLVGVGISGAYEETRPFIFAGGAVAAVLTFVLHEIAPERWTTPLKFGVEAALATALVTGLIAATGFASSPFFFAYYLIAVGVALTLGRRPTLLFAGASGLAYAAIVALDPRADAFTTGYLLRFSLNVGSVWLLAYLAAVFAAEERRARAAVLRLSVTDPLTGLYNRSHVYAALEQEIRRTRRSERGFCLVMMDLDGLKAINDSLGHHRGDDVLRAIGAVITRSIRTVDTAARYGGDEFVVLLPETDRSGAYVVAEKIRAGAEELTYGMNHEHLPTSVSIGLVYHPDDGATADELMIAADRAMYTAKSLGKNQISGAPDRRSIGRLPALTRSTDVRPATVAVPVAVDERPPTPMTPPASAPVAAPLSPPPVPASPAPHPHAATEPEAPVQPPPTPEPVMAAAPEETPASPPPPPATQAADAEAPEAPVAADPAVADAAPRASEDSTVVTEADVEPRGNGANYDEADDDLDPAEARRRIAKLSYDPDHQVRRAMDAFLSAPRGSGDDGN